MAKMLAYELSYQQNAFCQEYVKDHSGTKSAIRAGYSEKTATVQASTLLTKPNIQARINELETAKQLCYRVTVEQVAAELSKVAFLDIKSQFENINECGVTMKPFDQLDGTVIASVNEKRDKEGAAFIEIKFPDKMKALELLGKHLNMFSPSEKPPAENETNINITFVPVPKK